MKCTLTLHSKESLEPLKRQQLQKLAKSYGLKANGKNSELIERIVEHEVKLLGGMVGDESPLTEIGTLFSLPTPIQDLDQETPPVNGNWAACPRTSELTIVSDTNPDSVVNNAVNLPVLIDKECDPPTISIPSTSGLTNQSTAPSPNTDHDPTLMDLYEDLTADMDHLARVNMADVYLTLAQLSSPEPSSHQGENSLALKYDKEIDSTSELKHIAQCDLSEVYDNWPELNHTKSSPTISNAEEKPNPLQAIMPASLTPTRTNSGLYPTIDVTRSMDAKLTFHWTSQTKHLSVDGVSKSEPGSPCAAKASRLSAQGSNQVLAPESKKTDEYIERTRQTHKADNPTFEVRNGQLTSCQAPLKPGLANKEKNNPSQVVRSGSMRRKRVALNPVKSITKHMGVSTRSVPTKLPVTLNTRSMSTASTVHCTGHPPIMSRLNSTTTPSRTDLTTSTTCTVSVSHQPLKRKNMNNEALDDANLAKRLKRLKSGPAVPISDSSTSKTPSVPSNSSIPIRTSEATKKQVARPIFDLQGSLKRKLNYVPKKGPLKPLSLGFLGQGGITPVSGNVPTLKK